MRLVGAGGEQRGIVSRSEALAEARSSGLDLVLVAAEAEPPVCKVMDYGKHVFELKKTKAAQRKKQKQKMPNTIMLSRAICCHLNIGFLINVPAKVRSFLSLQINFAFKIVFINFKFIVK